MNTFSLSNQRIDARRALARPHGGLVRDGMLAGMIGGAAALAIGALLAVSFAADVWLPLKALSSLVLGSAALAQAGFVAGPIFAGLLVGLSAAALLGGLFSFLTRRVWGLPSDFGVPALTGVIFGLLLWLAVYLAVPAVLAAPAVILQTMAYGAITSLVLAKLRPQPYNSIQ